MLGACSWLEGDSGFLRVRALLSPFPVQVRASGVGADPGFIAQGLPGALILASMRIAVGETWACNTRICSIACSSSVNTVIVFASGVAEWRCAMTISPFGPNSVVEHGPYLGIAVGCVRMALTPSGGCWCDSEADVIREATGAKVIGKVETRAAALHGASSCGLRCDHWNTYSAPCLIYPAQLCHPPCDQIARIKKFGGNFSDASIALPKDAYAAIGVYFNIKEAPRPPLVVIDAAAFVSRMV